jgi:hypothetical protein
MAARCSGRGRNGRREAKAGCPRWLGGGGNGGAVGGEKRRRKKGCSTVGGGRPLLWVEAVDGGQRGGETGGGETAAGSHQRGKLVAAAAWSGRCGPNAVGPWFGPGG